MNKNANALYFLDAEKKEHIKRKIIRNVSLAA
jgi:hypothetical protein